MAQRDDVRAAVVLNDRHHERLEHAGTPVWFLPHVLAHRILSLFG